MLTLTTSLLPGGDGSTNIIPVGKMGCQLSLSCIALFHFFVTRKVGWNFCPLFDPTDITHVGETEGQVSLSNCCHVGPDMGGSIWYCSHHREGTFFPFMFG